MWKENAMAFSVLMLMFSVFILFAVQHNDKQNKVLVCSQGVWLGLCSDITTMTSCVGGDGCSVDRSDACYVTRGWTRACSIYDSGVCWYSSCASFSTASDLEG
jgi:hypothetical protein